MSFVTPEFVFISRDMLTCRLWSERRKQTSSHTLKACIGNLNGHVVAMSSAITSVPNRSHTMTTSSS